MRQILCLVLVARRSRHSPLFAAKIRKFWLYELIVWSLRLDGAVRCRWNAALNAVLQLTNSSHLSKRKRVCRLSLCGAKRKINCTRLLVGRNCKRKRRFWLRRYLLSRLPKIPSSLCHTKPTASQIKVIADLSLCSVIVSLPLPLSLCNSSFFSFLISVIDFLIFDDLLLLFCL